MVLDKTYQFKDPRERPLWALLKLQGYKRAWYTTKIPPGNVTVVDDQVVRPWPPNEYWYRDDQTTVTYRKIFMAGSTVRRGQLFRCHWNGVIDNTRWAWKALRPAAAGQLVLAELVRDPPGTEKREKST